MSGLLKAVIFGAIQGLAEFLPISSSGHLQLARKFPGLGLFGDPYLDKMFDVMLHVGTLVAVLIYFRSDLLRMLRDPAYRRLVAPILIATVPVGLVALKFEEVIEQQLGFAVAVAVPLILFGVLLWIADRRGRKVREVEQVRRGDAMLMTFAQALALWPGVSRSGITMTTGLCRGLTREAAVRLSFLISIPVIAGTPLGFAWHLLRHKTQLPAQGVEMALVGALTAAISGYLAIGYLLKFVRTKSFAPFMIYRLIVGLAILGLLLTGVLHP